jgi:valyl-tRNA synthetase
MQRFMYNEAIHSMDEAFLKPYNPQETEGRIYAMWKNSGYFSPEAMVKAGYTAADAPTWSIVMPPPNVTGVLHMGHALMLSVEDILTRFNRMDGKRALWIPGTDHAAIATQSKVEKEIQKKEGKSRYDLGREELLKRIEVFAKESQDTILSQVQVMGASCDWDRLAFTLDETRSRAVREAFVRMYEAGLIYRGERIVNWDPKGQTTIADDELVYKEERTTLYYLKYGDFEIATARPETKFGDKYVVVHPDDPRYAKYAHGDTFETEWINGPITATVIKDPMIDMSFGTGAMTITPWHSVADFDLAEKHNLDKEHVIDLRGRLLPQVAGPFGGMKITEARPLIIEKLREKGLVIREEEYVHNIATAERTGGVIEPQILKQWFVSVNTPFTPPGTNESVTLKEWMRRAVADGHVRIMPDHFDKTYFHWIENLRDWCISRQIWYGHRVPVWYRGEELHCSTTEPEGDGWEQDPDTLDTWFSSGLWTFSTLGWPEETDDLRTYHPTALLETGYEILFFWVARMILASGFLLGQYPFKEVYLHGTVRDNKGQKMSKSLGNGIDPLDIAKEFGADAGRLALISGTAAGTDSKISLDKVRGYKHFANKLWNATRFVLESQHEGSPEAVIVPDDQARLDELSTVAADVTLDIENYRLHLAFEKLYQWYWGTFADVIIEESKPIFKGDDAARKLSRSRMLFELNRIALTLLHPFAPFVTEEIWQRMKQPGMRDMLMTERWPR